LLSLCANPLSTRVAEWLLEELLGTLEELVLEALEL